MFYRQNTAYITEGDCTDFQRQVIGITCGYCSLNVEYKGTQKQDGIIQNTYFNKKNIIIEEYHHCDKRENIDKCKIKR